MKGKQKISLAMALLTVMSSAQPIFAFTPAKEETKQAIVSKADDILKNPAIQKHLLGTDYLAPKHNSTYTPGIDLSDYEDVEGKGKLYGKDGYILTPDQLKATHWYEIYSLATRAKEHVNSLDQNVADRLLDELNMVLQIYALNSSPQLKDDGDYTGTYRLVDVQLISQDGQTNVYQNLGTEKQDVKDLFQEMEVVKWGNELEVLFVANQKKVSKINSMLIKNVAGKEIRVSLGSGDAQDPTKTNLVAIPIPAELDGSQLVVEGMTYVDNQGVTQKTGKFGIDIDYKNMKKSSSNYKRYEKKTKARIKYWIKRGDILIGSYLDSRAPKDLEKIKTIRQSIVKLNALRNSDAPSMTEALKYAQPIYETENEFTLREILSGYIHVALEDLKSGTIYNEKKYTKESLDAFKKYLEKLQKDAADMNVVQLVAAISDVQSAGQNQVLKYTTKKLDKLLKKAEKYEAAYYEEESFFEFKTAEAKAKKWVEANKTYSPALDETEDHYRLLERAIANLKAKPGMTPPEIKDDDAKKPSKAIYEVPVTCRDTAIMKCLDGPVKYIPSEKKYIFSFKKDGDNFVKEAKSNTSNYADKTGTVTETAGEESGHKIAKTIEFIDPDNSLGMYLHVKYYNAERLGIEEKPNVQFTLDMDKKKLLGGAEEKPETAPYDVKVSYENQNGAGKTYMEQLVSDKVTYDPVKKTLTFTAMPEMAGAKVKSYVAMINYATGGTYKPVDITKKEERELVAESASERVSIPKTFVMKYDIARGDTINVTTDIVIGHTNRDKQKTGDIVRLRIKKAESKTGEEELKLLSDTLAKRRSELKVNAAAVDKLLPEVIKVGDFFESPEEAEQSSRQVAIKEAVKESLQKSEKVNEKDAEQIRRTIQQLDNLSEAILPWVSFSNTFHGAEKNLDKYKSDGHFTKASLEKIEGIIKGVRDQMNAPMERERVAQNHDAMLSVYEYLRLDYTELEELINEAEQKINSGKYQDAGVKALREILYGYNGKDRALRRASADDAFNPGQMQPMVLRNSHGAKAYLAEVKGDDVSGANLDTTLYDSWVYYIKEALKDLKEKQPGDVTKTALEDAIEKAEKALEKNKSKEEKDKLRAAIAEAKKAMDFTEQDKIDEAVEKLNTAVKTYGASKDVFKTEALQAEIDKAEKLLKATKKAEEVNEKLAIAIQEAKKGLNADSQDKVDAALKTLQAAVEEFQASPDIEDPNAHIEATKTVNIQLYKENKDEPSMAHSALWNQGKLTKENGKWYLEMQWVDMINGDYQSTGAITELTYTINGEKKKAQVLAEHEVKIGTNTFTSPTRVKIEVTENERFVPVIVSYKTSLGPEVHSPAARIAIDWKSATDGFNENTYKVDKGQLIDAVKVYEMLANGAQGVNQDLIKGLQANLEKAKAVIKNGDATIQEVKAVYSDLDKAGSAVKFADEIYRVHLAQLEANLREFKQEQGKYTAASIAKYEAVITQGKKALQKAKTYEEIKEAYDAIKAIDDNLRYDTSALEAKVEKASAMMSGQYTQDSKDNLDVKIKDAKKWIKEAKEKGIKAGYKAPELTKALDTAMKAMVKEGEAPAKVDKTKLKDLIRECEGMDLSKYTDESKTEFDKKLNEARTVANDDMATKEDVANALKDLKAAKEGLVEKQAPKEKVTVTFVSDKGTAPAAVTVEKGSAISAPAGFEENASKVKVGEVTYVFKGWFDGEEKFDFTKPVNGDKRLTARWEKMEAPAVQEAIYQVEFTWKQTNSDVDAMMGKVFKHPAQLIVKDGKAFFRVELQDASEEIYVTDMAYKGETLVPSKTTEVTVGGVTQTKPAAFDIPVDMNDVNKTFRLTVTVGAKGMKGKASADFVVDGGGKTPAQPAPKVDKKALNQLIAECDALDLSRYEEKGKSDFIAALKDAKAVSAKSTATKEDVELALTKLQQAKGALVQKKAPTPEEKPDTPKPDVKPDTKKPDVKPGYSGGGWYFSGASSKSEGKQTEPEKSQKNTESPKAPEANFSDTVNHWAKESINYVVSKGYFKGVGGNRFAPEQSITRADFVTVLGRMAGIDQSKFMKNAFKDVNGGYYAAYVNWASENGIVQGVGQGKFDPKRPITREEMAVIMDKFLQVTNKKFSEKESKNFTDDGTIAPWAKEAVQHMTKLGIVKGMDDGAFRPKSGFTRAQVAQVLYNMDHNK
ncbi:S-layer homology domain-containing protein [Aedoeadaptatus pacaensis]|uniref:S-layer homology domain-containing protein n=1 Tax=Aedoeadaptatus pacaensis TaxID=1776390 RepID=UPI0008381631|nr:S-layer homology domain-containing protein [Peptoniphilus pacaensis]